MFDIIAGERFCRRCGCRASICLGHAADDEADALGRAMQARWADKVKKYKPAPIERQAPRLPPHLRRTAAGWGDEETVAALEEGEESDVE
jgi:hypothetical protein